MNHNQISVVRTTDKPLNKDDIVTVYFSEKYMLISHKRSGEDVGYKKISNNQYLNTTTGEIKTIDKSLNDKRNINSLRNTFLDLSLLISLNFNGDSSEGLITLTYNRKVAEDNSVTKDIKNFWGRFCRFVDNHKLYKAIFVVEYQGFKTNYNPHIHLLLKRCDNQKMTLSELEIKSLWKNGQVDFRPIYDIDGLIDYLNPFHNNKKMMRLSCYKQYEKVFRCRGKINRPQKFKMTYNSALKIVEENNLIEHENDSYEVVSADSVVNVITKQCFRKKKGNDKHEKF